MYVNGLARLFQTGVAGVVDTLSRLEDSEQSGPTIARVTDVCLNSNSDLFKTAGWGGIGSISFQALNDQKPESGQNRVGSTLALPMFP